MSANWLRPSAHALVVLAIASASPLRAIQSSDASFAPTMRAAHALEQSYDWTKA